MTAKVPEIWSLWLKGRVAMYLGQDYFPMAFDLTVRMPDRRSMVQ